MSLHLPEVVTQVLRDNLEMEPAELALVRCRQLARWAVRAKQLGEANSNSSGICLSTCRYSGQKGLDYCRGPVSCGSLMTARLEESMEPWVWSKDTRCMQLMGQLLF